MMSSKERKDHEWYRGVGIIILDPSQQTFSSGNLILAQN